MFESAISGLNSILDTHEWVSSLAGILPFSALIDFTDLAPKLHVVELTGAFPLWSWVVTPSTSRTLLGDDENPLQACYLDRYGSSVALQALDGRYGNRYIIQSPETLRLCLQSQEPKVIENNHKNMLQERNGTQNLEIVHVSRVPDADQRVISPSWLQCMLLDPLRRYSHVYLVTTSISWLFWAAMVAMSCVLQTWTSLAFLVLIPLTGTIVLVMFGSRPRTLLRASRPSSFNRVIVVSEHENSTDWTVFYGESSILNSLLNQPLQPEGPVKVKTHQSVLRQLLRLLVLGQWATLLGASATSDWNGYFIAFWVAFCVFAHSFVLTPERAAKDWMLLTAKFRIERYQTQLSSRRALINAMVSLNPDTHPPKDRGDPLGSKDPSQYYEDGMKWIDPILMPGDRKKWQDATLEALAEAAATVEMETASRKHPLGDGNSMSKEWEMKYKGDYWSPFISEGIHVAAKIKHETSLPGHVVIEESKKV